MSYRAIEMPGLNAIAKHAYAGLIKHLCYVARNKSGEVYSRMAADVNGVNVGVNIVDAHLLGARASDSASLV